MIIELINKDEDSIGLYKTELSEPEANQTIKEIEEYCMDHEDPEIWDKFDEMLEKKQIFRIYSVEINLNYR